MAYTSISIQTLVREINKGKYYLPAIQRKFVWKEGKICDLFNSIMRDYPIGTFLFWELSAEQAKSYTFYEFLKNYHQRDSKNSVVIHGFPHDIKGVLDGQQRISSMFIALQGIYQTKKRYARKNNDAAYDERRLYLDLFDDKNEFNFKFLTEKAAKSENGKCYFLVREAFDVKHESGISDLVDDLAKTGSGGITWSAEHKEIALSKTTQMFKKFNDDNLISYFNIIGKDLDEILDIFVRVNSGGLVLSKSDLLFSTLVAHWEDGRKQIESLIESMNGRDERFKFNTDFLMRTCLFLIDAPMNFKIHSFDAKNILKIKDQWEDISQALLDAAELMRDFGFDHTRLSSNYALTPIAYYLLKGGIVNKATKLALRKFVVSSLLKQVYSGQADNTLRAIREGLRKAVVGSKGEYQLINPKFSYAAIKDIHLPGGKRIAISRQDVSDFLALRKGSQTFLVLSALYPHFKLDQIQFHQDHMHPQSKFKATVLSKHKVDADKLDLWFSMKDQLPNLQLMKGTENKSKQARQLDKWVESVDGGEAVYRRENYIPQNQSLAFADFESFFERRKNMLEKKLIKELVE